jgi:histidyl-tRNA synthetase
VVVLGIAGTDTPAAAAVARRLRVAGITAVLDASDRRLDRRLAAAARQGARAVVLVGEAEAAGGAATWKDLDSGHQETAPVDEVAGALRRLLAGG